MLKKLLVSFALAQQNIRSRLFHTLLSVLGIVIGVGALVTVLSLIDGMEKYANDQITRTTSLKAIMVQTQTHKSQNSLYVKKESYDYLTYDLFQELMNSLKHPVSGGYMEVMETRQVKLPASDSSVAASVHGINAYHAQNTGIATGKIFSNAAINARHRVAFVNHAFAAHAAGEEPNAVLGKTISLGDMALKVEGVLKDDGDKAPRVYYPVTLLSEAELKANPPRVIIEADNVERVPDLKVEVENWLKQRFKREPSDFTVITNEGRVAQATKGFLLFRIVMGLIVGISVIVGGIGVMNVLLISVTERTVEIGVRKAMGAKKGDILLQFLAESISVSLLGSLLGLVLGVLATLGLVPLVNALADVEFQAAYTLDTFVIIAVIAVIIGIIFGTYPATRAARLDPVEAIRRE